VAEHTAAMRSSITTPDIVPGILSADAVQPTADPTADSDSDDA